MAESCKNGAENRGPLRWVLRALPLFVMAAIFLFSSQTGEESTGTSNGVIEAVARAVRPLTGAVGEAELARLAESLSFAVRKAAHAGIYAALGLCTMLAMLTYPFSMRLRARAAILICAAYAAGDEIHQLFVPGRSGEVRDVMIDTAGAAAGILLALAGTALWRRWKNGRGMLPG